jgi:predicted AlkP superfamily pyrophosphatase or phosphodiesterase
MFWPGSDAEIAGDRPTYWRKYDGKVPNDARIDQILSWLKHPPAEQPTFVTLYFSDTDNAGHDFGPESPEIAQAIAAVDTAVARLVKGIDAAGLTARTNIVLVSDHGMSQVSRSRTIVLDDYIDVASVRIQDVSPILSIAPRTGSVDDLYRALKDKHPRLTIYKLSELPDRYRLRNHPRLLPIIGIVDDGWRLMTKDRSNPERFPGGDHGFDSINQSMHGLFLASGPAFKSGLRAPRFENVHVYELLCRVLGLTPASNDGDPKVTAGFLK